MMHDMYINRPIQFHSLLVQIVNWHIPNSVDQNSTRRSQPTATLEDKNRSMINLYLYES